jgi:chromosome segregation ATPase
LGERFGERLGQLKSASRPQGVSGEEIGTALSPSVSKELGQLFQQVKELERERKVIFDQIEILNSEISDAENKKAKAEKKIHEKYNKVELIDKGVKELERKMTITSTNIQ